MSKTKSKFEETVETSSRPINNTRSLPKRAIIRGEDNKPLVAVVDVYRQSKDLESFKKLKKLPKGFHLLFDFRYINPDLETINNE